MPGHFVFCMFQGLHRLDDLALQLLKGSAEARSFRLKALRSARWAVQSCTCGLCTFIGVLYSCKRHSIIKLLF